MVTGIQTGNWIRVLPWAQVVTSASVRRPISVADRTLETDTRKNTMEPKPFCCNVDRMQKGSWLGLLLRAQLVTSALHPVFVVINWTREKDTKGKEKE